MGFSVGVGEGAEVGEGRSVCVDARVGSAVARGEFVGGAFEVVCGEKAPSVPSRARDENKISSSTAPLSGFPVSAVNRRLRTPSEDKADIKDPIVVGEVKDRSRLRSVDQLCPFQVRCWTTKLLALRRTIWSRLR